MYHNVLESTLVKNISLIFSLDYVQATFLVVMTKHLTRENLWKAWEGVCCGSHGKEHGGRMLHVHIWADQVAER